MIPVVMTSFVKILQNIQGNPDEEERIMAGLNAAKLLIIDDLGAERSSRKVREDNQRYGAQA